MTAVFANHSMWAQKFAFMGTKLGAFPLDVFDTPPSEDASAASSEQPAAQARQTSESGRKNLRGSHPT